MIKAIWRSAAPGRLGMFGAVLAIVVLARLGGGITQGSSWPGSESQALTSLVVLFLLLPVFLAMLATGLMRGEHAPWSWGLARPVSRTRLIGAIVAIDALTIATCIGAAWSVLGGFGGSAAVFGGGFGTAAVGVMAALYVALYVTAAIGGARTDSTIRAAAASLLALGLLLKGLVEVTQWAMRAMPGSFGLHREWAVLFARDGAKPFIGLSTLWHPHALWVAAAIALGGAFVGGLALAFVRTARAMPGRVPWVRLLGPAFGISAIAPVLVMAGWVSARALAPAEARVGDVTLTVDARPLPNALIIQSVELRYEGGAVPHTLAYRFAPLRGRRTRWGFAALSAGHYEACAHFRRSDAPQDGDHLVRKPSYCTAVELTDEHQQSLHLDVALRDLEPPQPPS